MDWEQQMPAVFPIGRRQVHSAGNTIVEIRQQTMPEVNLLEQDGYPQQDRGQVLGKSPPPLKVGFAVPPLVTWWANGGQSMWPLGDEQVFDASVSAGR